MSYDLMEVAGKLAAAPREAIADWEAHYTDQLEEVAQLVLKNREKTPVVLLAGPSGSSKTTTGKRLRQLLISREVPAHLVSMDNYYLPWDTPDFPLTPEGERDLESPGCLDIALINRHFALLERGADIDVPIYNFSTHTRMSGRFLHLDAEEGDVFIFEGIHALNPLFTEQHPEACRIYVSPVSSYTLEGREICSSHMLRLMRRVVRDHQFRGATAEYSLGLWENVLSSEKIYIEPHRAEAHATVDTTLAYELQALRPFVLPLLGHLPETTPCYERVARCLSCLQMVESLPPSLVPGNSILREFIGTRPAPAPVPVPAPKKGFL